MACKCDECKFSPGTEACLYLACGSCKNYLTDECPSDTCKPHPDKCKFEKR